MEFQELMLKKDSDFQKRLKDQEETSEKLLDAAKTEAEEEKTKRVEEVAAVKAELAEEKSNRATEAEAYKKKLSEVK